MAVSPLPDSIMLPTAGSPAPARGCGRRYRFSRIASINWSFVMLLRPSISRSCAMA